jgi:hypothetical protein
VRFFELKVLIMVWGILPEMSVEEIAVTLGKWIELAQLVK